MYGYRYTPAGRVFELPGADLADAIAQVHQRRHTQSVNSNKATVELVERVGDTWQYRPLPEVAPAPVPAAKPAAKDLQIPKHQPSRRRRARR